MSILLDALRKSENQRRRGELPNIHTGMPIEGPTRRAHAAWPWAVALLVLLLAAALAWRLGWLGPPPDPDALPATTPLTQVGPAAQAPAQQVALQPPPSDTAATGARTPLERLRDQAPEGAEPVVVDGPVPPPVVAGPNMADIASDGPSTPGDGVDVHPLGSAPPPTADSPSAAVQPDPVPQRAPAQDAADLRAAVAEATRESPPVPTPAPAPATTPAPPEQPPPLEFWELPLEVRQGLPDFRITVLVYDQDPARRFVLLNGERRVEGDQVAPGVLLETVRRDGAVFRHEGYRFLVKR